MVIKEDCKTYLIYEWLKECNDIVRAYVIAKALSIPIKTVSTALWQLRNYKAVEAVEQMDRLWWFATPETDTRMRHIVERSPEKKPRKRKIKETK